MFLNEHLLSANKWKVNSCRPVSAGIPTEADKMIFHPLQTSPAAQAFSAPATPISRLKTLRVMVRAALAGMALGTVAGAAAQAPSAVGSESERTSVVEE